jgi:hypothetical protein
MGAVGAENLGELVRRGEVGLVRRYIQVWSDKWSRARESEAEWRNVAEGSLEPSKRENA